MALAIWAIILIVIGSLVLLICFVLLLYKYCSKVKKRKKSAFAWLDRLGIPFAREGTPDLSTLPRGGVPSRYMAKSPGHARKGNGIDNDEFDSDEIPPALEGADDPFKRLDHIGIPRANRNNISTTNPPTKPTGKVAIVKNKRPPSTPLPSILSDDSSQDEMSFDVFSAAQETGNEPQETGNEADDETRDLPPPPPELMVNNEPYLDSDEPYMGNEDPYMENIRSVYDVEHVESDYENDFP